MPTLTEGVALKPFRLDPCPAEERVGESYYDDAEVYEELTKNAKAYKPRLKNLAEGVKIEDGGIIRQKCGGGHRIVRKRIH